MEDLPSEVVGEAVRLPVIDALAGDPFADEAPVALAPDELAATVDVTVLPLPSVVVTVFPPPALPPELPVARALRQLVATAAITPVACEAGHASLAQSRMPKPKFAFSQ